MANGISTWQLNSSMISLSLSLCVCECVSVQLLGLIVKTGVVVGAGPRERSFLADLLLIGPSNRGLRIPGANERAETNRWRKTNKKRKAKRRGMPDAVTPPETDDGEFERPLSRAPALRHGRSARASIRGRGSPFLLLLLLTAYCCLSQTLRSA